MELGNTDLVTHLENGSLERRRFNINEMRKKAEAFTDFLTSEGMLLKYVNESEWSEIKFTLIQLKKEIQHTLDTLRSQNPLYRSAAINSYKCGKCGEIISIDSRRNFWDNFQNHDHFESVYYEAISNFSNSQEVEIFVEDSDSSIETPKENFNENNDSGIEHIEDCTTEMPETSQAIVQEDTSEAGINNFQFGFKISYDVEILSKVYLQSVTDAVRKIDRCKEFTVQKTGPSRTVCLLCARNLIAKHRISRTNILEHVRGQTHLKNAANAYNLDMLSRYHELWLSYEAPFQAHQVYFMPKENNKLLCILCHIVLPLSHSHVKDHVETVDHKRFVLKMYQENNTEFCLVPLQVQCYGYTAEEIIQKAKDKTGKNNSSESKAQPGQAPKKTDERQTHNIIKAIQNDKSPNVLELIPNRFKDHLNFFEVKDDRISCKACAAYFCKDIGTLKKHIRQTDHLIQTGLELGNYSYYCEICNTRYEGENQWEKHFEEGPNNHINIAPSRLQRVTEYECTVCRTVIFGDELSLSRHLSVRPRKKQKQKQSKVNKWAAIVKKLFVSAKSIDRRGLELMRAANEARRDDDQLMRRCCERLEEVLKPCFPQCRAYPFGSRVSGLGFVDSDLDVFIDVGDMYNGTQDQDPLEQEKIVRRVANRLSKYSNEFQDIQKVVGARTPIVRVYHEPTDIECDLSFRHGLSIENTKFIRFCMDIQPITQILILLIKEWAECVNLKEHERISNYTLAIMAIFYLQVEGQHLLSVKEIREINNVPTNVINGWETLTYAFSADEMEVYVRQLRSSVKQLLRDFFYYYSSTFKYDTDVVCPLLGHPIKIKQFENVEDLPPEMNSYVRQLKGNDPEYFKFTSQFCVQDPFDLSHNLTKAWQLGTVSNFKTLCTLTYQHLDTL